MAKAVKSATATVAVEQQVDEIEHLRFAPQILARLGEELNPNPDQGVLELVRNAYDADALRCVVQLENITEPGGIIAVRDWGIGIDRGGVADGWLVLGRSSKKPRDRTDSGRLQVGQKGLGRLAALRQGSEAVLKSWPRSRKGAANTRIQHSVVLNWAEFDRAKTVDAIPVHVMTSEVEPTPTGTEVTIRDLRRAWTRPEVKRLARTLLLLSDPFRGAKNTFEIELICPEHPDLENLVAGSYFDYSHWSIEASLDSRGRAKLRLLDTRLGIDEEATHQEISAVQKGSNGEPYKSLPARFELHGFVRSSEALHGMGSAATLQGLQDWLDTYGGVHIYHRGLRVGPYGDPGSDWLDMNLLRARNPEQRPSTNNAVGRIIVEDPEGRLVQKTDRSGFIEDEDFLELRRFGRDVLEWVGRRRTKVADDLREREKKQGPQRRQKAKENLDKAIDKLPAKQRKSLQTAAKRFEKEAEKDAEQLRDDLLLYRTLATIGTTSAQIAHETYNPALAIIDLAKELEAVAKENLPPKSQAAIAPPVSEIEKLAARLRDYARLPRVLLSEPRRRMRVFAGDRAVADTIAVFTPYFDRHHVDVREEHQGRDSRLRGPSALVDAILSNLVINSVRALDHQADGARKILIRTSADEDTFVLEVADSGPGIQDIQPEEIWVPGATTTPDGTGLGLTIVRDSAEQLGGTVSCEAEGELGGAQFTIRLPMAT